MRVTKKSVVTLLKLAKQKIQEGGFSKNDFWKAKNGRAIENPKPGCRCCTIGAIRYANQELFGSAYSDIQYAAINVLKKTEVSPGAKCGTIILYNDNYNTKKKDILRWFDAAISNIEKGKIKMGDIT